MQSHLHLELLCHTYSTPDHCFTTYALSLPFPGLYQPTNAGRWAVYEFISLNLKVTGSLFFRSSTPLLMSPVLIFGLSTHIWHRCSCTLIQIYGCSLCIATICWINFETIFSQVSISGSTRSNLGCIKCKRGHFILGSSVVVSLLQCWTR